MKCRTGNDSISLIDVTEALAVRGMTTLSMEQNGNLFVDSEQDFAVFVDGKEVDLGSGAFDLVHYWIPRVTATRNGARVTATLLAPKGSRGFIHHVTFQTSRRSRIRVVRRFSYRSTKLCINRSYQLDTHVRRSHDAWFDQELLDIYMGKPLLCLAFGADRKCSRSRKGTDLQLVYEFECDGEQELNLYTAAGMEEMAAMSVNVEFGRRGFSEYFDHQSRWLASRTQGFDDPRITRAYNTNLFFNYFFACGVTIDTQETVCVTSRSPDYYVCAAYWDRDALLWSFPALMLVDMDRARDVLDYVFRIQGKNFGIHSRFINGNTLECGFELDQLAAPFIALHSYLEAGGSSEILGRAYVKARVDSACQELDKWLDRSTGLFVTELRPSDDMVKYPFNTYDNVLVWKALLSLAAIFRATGSKRNSYRCTARAAALKRAVLRHGVTKGKDPVFAYEFDCRGNYTLYEEPPGSLKLLHHYGFIDKSIAPVYANTLKWIYSSGNPHYYSGRGSISESGCDHAPHPWVLSACNSLLTPGFEKVGLDFFRNAPMDSFVASESVHEKDGTAATGAAFATCAGFVAYCLHRYRVEER